MSDVVQMQRLKLFAGMLILLLLNRAELFDPLSGLLQERNYG
ncbi:hypothetical protein [Paenibacillus sp. sptzw28]|nr:hypothetical protein [Paenibacillus sp. sptzw28]